MTDRNHGNRATALAGGLLVVAATAGTWSAARGSGGLFLAPLVTGPAAALGGAIVGHAVARALGVADRSGPRVSVALAGGLLALAGPVVAYAAAVGTGLLALLGNAVPPGIVLAAAAAAVVEAASALSRRARAARG